MASEKSKTNKKWTSTDNYRGAYERIFGYKTTEDIRPCSEAEGSCELGEEGVSGRSAGEVLGDSDGERINSPDSIGAEGVVTKT